MRFGRKTNVDAENSNRKIVVIKESENSYRLIYADQLKKN